MIHCHSCIKESPDVKRYYYLEADLCDACFDKYVKNPKENESKTLRDEFAMAALNAFLECETFRMEHTKDVSKSSYEIADAMLEARKAKGE